MMINKADEIYESIVEALSEDFFDLYYVDTETEDYIEYGSVDKEGERGAHGCLSLRYKPFPCRKHLRFRVFCDAGKKTEIEDRFECAKIAAERVKDDPERKVGYYVTE